MHIAIAIAMVKCLLPATFTTALRNTQTNFTFSHFQRQPQRARAAKLIVVTRTFVRFTHFVFLPLVHIIQFT